jgi:hypothetical protein
VASNPEALAQLARLLGNHALRTSTSDEVRAAASANIDRLADGLVAEAAASDDVTDRESALEFLESRIRFFNDLFREETRTRLWDAIQVKIDAW